MGSGPTCIIHIHPQGVGRVYIRGVLRMIRVSGRREGGWEGRGGGRPRTTAPPFGGEITWELIFR